MVDLQGTHFNAKKTLYIYFQKHALICCKEMLIKIMVESTADDMSFQQAYVILQIMICQWRTDTVTLYTNTPLQIL